jgi:hypothetical protein
MAAMARVGRRLGVIALRHAARRQTANDVSDGAVERVREERGAAREL